MYDGASVKAEKKFPTVFPKTAEKNHFFSAVFGKTVENFFLCCFGKWKNGGEKNSPLTLAPSYEWVQRDFFIYHLLKAWWVFDKLTVASKT